MNLRLLVSVFAALICSISSTHHHHLPEKFLGEWEIAEGHNFNEYLKARGYGWVMRKFIENMKVVKVFEKSANQTNSYNSFILTPVNKNAHWYNWRLGEPFIGKYVDGYDHNITFAYDSETGKFTETHHKIGDPDDSKVEVCIYDIDCRGYLEMRIEYDGVVSTRYYAKEEPRPCWSNGAR